MLKKFGEKITKKSLLIASGIAIALVAIIIAIAIVSSKVESSKKKSFMPDNELARAMTYDQFSDEDSNVEGTDYVKFGAFFLRDINNDGYAEKIKGTCKQVGKEDTLYMELNVLTNGYLENGVITINSDNFYLQTAIPKDSEVKDNVISNNTKQISLNQINNGTQKLLTGIVRTGDYSYDSQKFAAIGNDTTKYSKINSVTLTGTHVAADGTRTQINKTVEFNMDWYGTTKTEIPNYIGDDPNLNQSKDNTDIVDEENNQVVFNFDIGIQEINNQLILSKACIEGEIPKLNGYNPVKVGVDDSNAEISYDDSTRRFVISKSAELNEDGTIKRQCYDNSYYEKKYNKFKLRVIYPLEAYDITGADAVEIKIPISAYYEGYNNENSEFTNPYRSEPANGTIVLTYKKPNGDVAIFDVRVGEWTYVDFTKYIVSKRKPLNIYNGVSATEQNDTYEVRWLAETGNGGKSEGITMKETKNGESQVYDEFIKADSTTESMDSVSTNVGIYFSNPADMLGDDGWIKIYNDENNELIHEFNKDDWNKYSKESPYKYEVAVKHIRIVTSATEKNKSLYVYNVKELNDDFITNNYSRAEFDNLKYIKSTLTGYIDENFVNTDTNQAFYETPYSLARISVNKEAISTQETEKNLEINIRTAKEEKYNQEAWKNGIFLVKLPEDIIDAEINDVEISRDDVNIISKEIYTDENGDKYIKIITENDEAVFFDIVIKCTVSADPRILTKTENVELYAYNEDASDYYKSSEDIYDINGNLNTTEIVNKTSAELILMSPNSLLTNQVAVNYDNNGSVAIAPQIAIVSKEKRSATIDVEINNNYSSTISDVVIIGRTPFKDNKYTLSKTDMGSTFTATMTNDGITLPDELKNTATVYYSENGEATKNLSDKSNGWTKTPADFTKVKSYLVDFSNHKFNKGERYTISYNINIPDGLNYNQVSYSHHAVYFSLDTAEGKYKTQTEPNKVGLMIAKQYDLDGIKYQIGKDKKISGATYAVYEDGSEDIKTRFTNADGKFTLSGLFVDRTYVIKEIKSPDDYELNEEVVKFTTSESDGKISVTKVEGNVKNISVIDSKVQIQLEDEVKAKLKISKIAKDTSVGLKNVKYKITGKGINNSGKILTTDSNGEILFAGLYIGEEYTLEEIKADGYYLPDGAIKFVINNNGTYVVNVIDGNVKETQIIEDNDIPVVNLKVEDEKIPTYNLEINKVVKGETTPLSNVKFALESKDSGKIEYYITDEAGKVNIQGLYQYRSDKSNTAEYILKEITTPEGYSTMKDVTFRVENNNGNLQVNVLSGDVKESSSDGTNVKIVVENAPIFILTKRDKDTNELIPNTEFRIYNVNDNDFARDIDGNYVGIHEKYSQVPLKSVGDYGWKKNSDGTLQSENYHVGKSKSTLKAEIEIMEKGKLDFDWSVSSESPNYDYFYVEIKNLNDDSQVHYDKIEGTEYGTEYSELQYTHKTIELEPGKYSLEFTYRKDAYTDAGLDSGFLKNITIDTDIYSPYYYVKTDDEGKINLKLQSGVYKAVETKSNEMYQFSENEEKRTYYFGIDESKDGVEGLLVDGYLYEENTSTIYVKCVTKTSDGGYAICADFYPTLKVTDDIVFESENNDDYDTSIIKYNGNGDVEWAKHIGAIGDVVINDIEETSDDGLVVVGGSKSKKVNIADEQILTQNTNNTLGFILKYNNNGNLLWSSKTELELINDDSGSSAGGGATYLGIRNVIETSDGMYVASQTYGSYRVTYRMKLQNGTDLNSYGEGDIALIKFNNAGEIIFSDTIGGKYSDYSDSIVATSDGGYIINLRTSDDDATEIEATGTKITLGPAVSGYGCRRSVIIKYNKENKVDNYINNSENERLYALTTGNKDEFLVCGQKDSKGFVRKYGYNNNVIWETDFDDSVGEIFKGIDNGYIAISGDNLYLITDKGEIKYTNSFKYLCNKVLDVGLIENNKFIAVGALWDATINLIDGKKLTPFSYYTNGMVLEYSVGTVEEEINPMKELTVYNEKKKYNITTKVDGNIGGSITGDGEKPFEIVAYNEDSVKDIIMKPDEGYQIEKVTINGENCDYIDNNDGTYTINKFKNMREDKEVIVKYANKDSCLEINKTDEKTGEAISGVEFNVQQEYDDKALENVLGNLKNDNGVLSEYYYTGADLENPKELTWENVGNYYFVESNGKYIPTNGKTYRETLGESTGVTYSTAHSYIKIDLSDMEGSYLVKVNASCSSYEYNCYGYAKVTENENESSYYGSDGRFMDVSGTVVDKNYVSNALEGGKVYYLHFWYYKGSKEEGDDQVVINSVKVIHFDSSECGEPISNSDYEFVKTDLGTYIPTNGKKYQESIGKSSGVQSSCAESIVEIDLTDKTGDYAVGVTAKASTEKGQDFGYAMITQDTEVISNISSGFMYISGNVASKTYCSSGFIGGNKYYLHIGYKKDSSMDSGDDSIEIEKITLYPIEAIERGMTEIDGKYKINANIRAYNNAHSYIPLDLTKYNGEYLLKIQAEVNLAKSSEAYIHLAENTEIIPRYITTNRILYLNSATTENTEYVTKLQGGKMYYIQIGFYGYNVTKGNEFIINSIKVYQDPDNLYNQTVKTDENGKAVISLGPGKYNIEETKPADGYVLNNQSVEVDVNQSKNYLVNITNKQMAKLIVHHYIKGTTTKLADDENEEAHAGDSYTTNPKLDLDKYELEKDSNGAFVLPANAVGKYKTGTTEVTYYYVEKQIPLTVHHYIEGTTEKVPLKAGGTADDVTGSGKEGESYTTSAISNDKLSDEYELVEVPANASGTYSGNEVIVTYYYKKVSREVNLVKYKEDGKTPLAGAKFRIEGNEYTTDTNGKIQVKLEAGIHDITEIEAPEGYKLPENPTTKVTISKATPETVNITNEKKTGTVTVHHYIQGTTTKVTLADGSTAADVVKTGNVGDMYATKSVDNLSERYELVSEPSNGSGTYIDGNIEVIYYYKTISTSVIVHHYLEGTTTKLADDVTFDGIVGDNYTTGVATVDSKYEVVAIPANANGKMTREQTVVIYYYRVKDTSVLVHHYIKGTTTSLSADVTINGKIDDKYTTTIADDIPEQYELVAEPTNKLGTMTEAQIVVTYYYQLKNYPYTVNYLEKGTGNVLHDAKQGGALTYGNTVKSSDEKIDIDGYNYDSVDKETLTIGTTNNVINIYYTKRTDLNYKVNYLEKGTNKVLHDQKVQNGMTFESTVTSANEVIDIDGYNYDSVDKDTLKITTGENVINIYYTKRNDLSYTVNYLEKDTNKVLHNPKNQTGMTFGEIITSSDEIIEIDGYDYNSVDKNSISIGTKENVINIYYTKRTDLSYKVNYLEKTTNKVLHDQKVQGGMTFESVVTSANEVIDIDGYNYDSVDKATLKITTGENVINIYYTKRTDLSYTVNYLEKTTNKVLHTPRTVENKTFGDVIKSVDEKIDIDGYNYDSVDKDTLTITTGENVINIYYTKRNDLSYIVNYLEKGTNEVINPAKAQDGMTFEDVITSQDEVIAIDGYNYDSVDKDTLTIGTGENVINIYYTKRTDLSYKVNYLEKGTNKVLHDQKVQENMTFKATVKSSDEVIDIDGYDYDSVDKDTLTITTGENVINIYYTKRTDLSYKVNYLEKETNKVLHDQKIQDGMTFESVVTSANEVIDIDGYNYDSVDKETLTITTGENVINIYYTKRNDLSYTVNYLEKTTNKVLHEQKIQEGMAFESTVTSADEVIDIEGYNYDSVDKDILTITTGENVINIYYTKKDTKVTVHYYEEGTTNKVSEDVEIPGKVFDDYTTESASDIPSKYELVAEPENKNGTMTEDEITVIYYYRKKATQVIVHYYEENTTKKLSEDVTINGRVDDKYTTVSASDIPIKYELVAEPVNKSENMTEATIEVIYYYRVKDAVVHVRYLEKGTDIVLADPDRIDGKVDEDYQTMQKEIDGYQLVEHTGNEKGKFEVEPLTITYYYLYKTKATVQYIDKITGQILEQSTTEGLEGDDFVTESKDFENYVLVEEPPEKTVKMTKEEQVLKYYYIHISGGVIEKHIDIISNEILANDAYEGNEGDEYDIPSKTFDGYDLVEDRLPSNAKGIMKVEPVEVIYYYIYRSKVTAEYIDKNTGEKLTDDVTQNGHEGDNYITDRKTFDDYKLVEVPSNADGSMTKEDITVTYYYVHTSGGVIVNHIDIKTGKQLLDETKEEGYEGDPYETHEENIPEYDLVKEKYPENATGKMTIEPTRVTYYYIKKAKVNIKYVDKETGEEIDEPTNIPGHEGDDYTTEPKDVPGYDLIEEPENKDGTMTADPIDVIYYYKRPAKVIVNYYDIDTKEKLADEIEIDGHQNDDYTTEQKDIEYYEIAKVPENKEGKMIVTVTKDENDEEIVDDTTYVNYYYRKLIFNLRVDKTIVSVIVNGQETGINGTLGKVEVHRKNISTANVKVVYKIKVTNDSELSGKANVVENIPSGMTMLSENNPDWTIKETTASLETDEIKPGESREYQVVLGWQNGDNNVGTKTNMVSITTENEANFDEQFETDNVSKADLIVAVGTGEVPYAKIAGGVLIIMIAMTAGIYVIRKRK